MYARLSDSGPVRRHARRICPSNMAGAQSKFRALRTAKQLNVTYSVKRISHSLAANTWHRSMKQGWIVFHTVFCLVSFTRKTLTYMGSGIHCICG